MSETDDGTREYLVQFNKDVRKLASVTPMTSPAPEQAYWCATCDRKRLHHTHPNRPSMHNPDGSYKFPSVGVQR